MPLKDIFDQSLPSFLISNTSLFRVANDCKIDSGAGWKNDIIYFCVSGNKLFVLTRKHTIDFKYYFVPTINCFFTNAYSFVQDII